MKQFYEGEPFIDVLEMADTRVNIGGWQGVVAQTNGDGGFEGTILYFPGVTLKQLGLGRGRRNKKTGHDLPTHL